MNTQNQERVERATAQTYARRLLGATGLNRATLASVLRDIGLFGEDSSLSLAQRAAVSAAVGALPGFAPAAPVPAVDSAEFPLYAFAKALLNDDSAETLWGEAADEDEAHREVRRVVGNVIAVFGRNRQELKKPLVSKSTGNTSYAQAA